MSDLLLEPFPKPLGRPNDWTAVVSGWCCNVYRLRSYSPSDCVWQAWQRGDVQYTNAELRNGSRNCEPMYATRREACVALAHTLDRETKELMKRIAEIEAEESPE